MSDTPRIEELKRRVELDPASIAFAALAEEYRRAGRFEEAIATCTTGLHRHPAYLSAHVTLGRSLIEVARFDEARAELEYVLKLAPENLAAIRGLAEIHRRRSDDDHAHHTAALDEHARRDAALNETARRDAALNETARRDAALNETARRDAALNETARRDAAAKNAGPAPSPAPEFAASGPADETVDREYRVGVFDPDVAPQAAQPDPALAGLEAFLGAIERARNERAVGR